MEFTKKDAATFATLCKEKKAQVHETHRLLEKRSRHLMEQSALLKLDIDTFKNDLATIGFRDSLTRVAHVCECAPLCPAIWRTLPVELLECIFARLPLLDIIRLRVLSKTWDKNVTGVTPGFTQLCAKQNPNMFALISEEWDSFNDLWHMVVKLYNSKENRWHCFEHQIEVSMGYEHVSTAGDGGLVCFVFTAVDKGRYPLKIVVFNPLTRQQRELPSSSCLSRIYPRMVQLVMDRDSNCYKVLVVGTKKRGRGDAVARIYSSATGQWSQPNIFADLIFGSCYSWKNSPSHGEVAEEKRGHCAYDCASSTLLELDNGNDPKQKDVTDKSVFVKDHLFVLHENVGDKYLLKEYQAQSCQPHWVPLRVHKCSELDRLFDHAVRLFGCQDFLVVIAHQRYVGYKNVHDVHKNVHMQTMLFDLSTSQWQIIAEIPEWSYSSNMFELRWDAIP